MVKWIYRGDRKNVRGRWIYDGTVWESDERPCAQFEEVVENKKKMKED